MTSSVLRRIWPLLLVLLLLICSFYFKLNHYLTFKSMQAHHQYLVSWTNDHYLSAVVLFILCYILCVALPFPGTIIFKLIGGLLFGLFWGALFVVISATMGAIFIFLSIKYVFRDWVTKRASGWINKMQTGFKNNTFSYVLFLRLTPVFPFWLINIVSALFNVKIKAFILATVLGIIPSTLIYTSIGNSLNHLFEQEQIQDFKLNVFPELAFPLLALLMLSLMCVLYKKIKDRHEQVH